MQLPHKKNNYFSESRWWTDYSEAVYTTCTKTPSKYFYNSSGYWFRKVLQVSKFLLIVKFVVMFISLLLIYIQFALFSDKGTDFITGRPV